MLIIIAFVAFYLWLNFHNDPIIRQSFEWPSHFEFWHIPALIIFIFFIVAYIHPNPCGPVFFQKNKLILPLIATVWYASFESWISFQVIIKSKHTNNITVQTKAFGTIKTDSVIIDAGRTKNYWFYYNRNTHITRAIKTEDIEFADFNSQNK